MHEVCPLIANNCKLPLVVHLADHSSEFERLSSANILRGAAKLVCITEEMKSMYERTPWKKRHRSLAQRS